MTNATVEASVGKVIPVTDPLEEFARNFGRVLRQGESAPSIPEKYRGTERNPLTSESYLRSPYAAKIRFKLLTEKMFGGK